jgi:hypothetical protein
MNNRCDRRDSWMPGCAYGKAEVKLIVTYNECEKDELVLCKSCADYISKDAKNNGYSIKRIKITR